MRDMLKNRPKAEVKKALPNLFKATIHMIVAFIVGYSYAHHVVNTYGGQWPDVAAYTIVINLVKSYGGWGAVYVGATTLYELYRRRKLTK